MYYKSPGYRIFSGFNTVLLLGLSLLCIMPLVHVFAVSLSAKAPANANLVGFWPIGFTVESYTESLGNERFLRALFVAVERTALGTLIGMLVIVMAAYPLSKAGSAVRGRGWIVWFFVFTMLFNGGLIPWYIVVKELNLMNTLWALILPSAVNVWNMILLMNFYKAIPKELEEASFIDGATVWTTLFRIYLPLSLPAIATLSLFTMVMHWNSWFDGLLFMKFEDYPLSSYLQTVVVQMDFSKAIDPSVMENFSQRTIKASRIFISTLPILLVYPFLQRFFVKGIVLGSVKE